MLAHFVCVCEKHEMCKVCPSACVHDKCQQNSLSASHDFGVWRAKKADSAIISWEFNLSNSSFLAVGFTVLSIGIEILTLLEAAPLALPPLCCRIGRLHMNPSGTLDFVFNFVIVTHLWNRKKAPQYLQLLNQCKSLLWVCICRALRTQGFYRAATKLVLQGLKHCRREAFFLSFYLHNKARERSHVAKETGSSVSE